MEIVPSAEFQRKIGYYQDKALVEHVASLAGPLVRARLRE